MYFIPMELLFVNNEKSFCFENAPNKELLISLSSIHIWIFLAELLPIFEIINSLFIILAVIIAFLALFFSLLFCIVSLMISLSNAIKDIIKA